jgi:hypothetical protein
VSGAAPSFWIVGGVRDMEIVNLLTGSDYALPRSVLPEL